jgi:Spy/CpxP family protein refolding chaperone
MKISKLSLAAALALGGLLACSTLASAQDAPKEGKKGGRMGIEQRMERLSSNLNLTDAQKPKVKALLEETQKKSQELRNDTSVPAEEKRPKMRAIMEEEMKKMKEILTPEQWEKYQQMAPGRRGPGGDKKGENKKSE